MNEIGQFHSFLVHFPITMAFVLVGLPVFFKKKSKDFYFLSLLCLSIGVLTSLVAVILGLFLVSSSAIYDPLVIYHQRSGVLVFLGFLMCFLVRKKSSRIYRWAIILNLWPVIACSFLGGTIAHGRDYLWGPLQSMWTP